MPLPNFLCVGAQKAGTTTLYNILKQHPEIYLPDIKETKFFNEKYEKGIDFYKQFFCEYRGEKAIGEIDPDYMFFEVEKVVPRIHKHLGSGTKLIFMLRNPVDRAYSHYWMNIRRGYEKESFERAVELESKRIKKNPFYKHNFSYISRGYYGFQIKKFLEYFPIENMFFVVFEEDFLKNRKKLISRLLQFLDVRKINLDINIRSNTAALPRVRFFQNIIYNPNSLIKMVGRVIFPNRKIRENFLRCLDRVNQKPFVPPKLDPSFRKYLMEKYFAKEIKELETLINRDLRIWYIDIK